MKKPAVTVFRRALIKFEMTFGRDDWIRTSGPLHPMQVRYRAAPHPETF